jgi:hypothetical protein
LADWSAVCSRFSTFLVYSSNIIVNEESMETNCHEPTYISWFPSLLWQVLCRIAHYTPCPDLDGIFYCFTRRKKSTISASPFSLSCNEINHFYCMFVLHTSNIVNIVQLDCDTWYQCYAINL